MKHRLTTQDILLVGITLFSMFFGSGNLIFPPWLGFQAGTATAKGLLGMAITAVIFPVLGIIAIAQSKDLRTLASKAGTTFSTIFTILIFLALGPGLAIPRNAAVSFEMAIVPFMDTVPLWVRITYSIIFFAIALRMSLHPDSLTDTLGKILGPLLLAMILILVSGCFANFSGSYAAPQSDYVTSPVTRGFLEGYNTMDTLAALNFGNIVVLNLKKRNITEQNDLISGACGAGLVAGLLLFIIYAAMANLGALSGSHLSQCHQRRQRINQYYVCSFWHHRHPYPGYHLYSCMLNNLHRPAVQLCRILCRNLKDLLPLMGHPVYRRQPHYEYCRPRSDSESQRTGPCRPLSDCHRPRHPRPVQRAFNFVSQSLPMGHRHNNHRCHHPWPSGGRHHHPLPHQSINFHSSLGRSLLDPAGADRDRHRPAALLRRI